MPIGKPLVSSWSFSRYMDYTKCPFLFKCKHIDKLKEPPSAPMQRGTDLHKIAEDYLNGKLKKLPAEFNALRGEYEAWRKQKVKVVEEQWTWKQDWSPTDWNDWSGAWLRVKLDFAYINVEHNALVIVDHKTGKFREDKQAEYDQQEELYGLAGLKRYPDVAVVSPRLAYIDAGLIYPNPDEMEIEFFRKDEKALEKKWLARIKPLFNDKTFRPTPGDACRFCHFRKSNNGPCKF